VVDDGLDQVADVLVVLLEALGERLVVGGLTPHLQQRDGQVRVLLRRDEQPVEQHRQALLGVGRFDLADGGDEPVQDVVEKRRQQLLFRVVVVMYRGGRLAVLRRDPLDREVGVPVLAERAVGRPHDLLVRLREGPPRWFGHAATLPATGE
jgi:hypothetical protein